MRYITRDSEGIQIMIDDNTWEFCKTEQIMVDVKKKVLVKKQ